MNKIDVTEKVDFELPDDENLPLHKCICREIFHEWTQVVRMYPKINPIWKYPKCQTKLFFSQEIRVYKVENDI